MDELFSSLMHTQETTEDDHDDSGEESEGEDDDMERHVSDDEEEAELEEISSPTDERPASPDTLVLLNHDSSEHLGPTEEDEAEFEKELAKLITETTTTNRKIDKRSAQGQWDAAVVPTTIRKKKTDESDGEGDNDDSVSPDGQATMKFMLLTKKGNKQQASLSLRSTSVGLNFLSC